VVGVPRSRLLLAGLAALLALSACGDLESAAAAGNTRDDLAGDLAAQMARSADLTYTATYQLAGGETATIAQAQDPARAAYTYPSGKIIVSATGLTRCAKGHTGSAMTCTVTAPETTAASPAPPGVVTAATRSGLILPETVLGLLNAASLDTAKTEQQHDTTIAGHHASCVELSGVNGAEASAFTACITNEGLLGSFTGTIDTTKIDAAMTRFSPRTDADTFTAPENATILDHRRR
jgi:hypothetical protein